MNKEEAIARAEFLAMKELKDFVVCVRLSNMTYYVMSYESWVRSSQVDYVYLTRSH